MKKKLPIGPILALVLLAGLSAWVFLKEGRPGGAPADDAKEKDRAVEFKRDDLKAIAIHGEHGDIRLEKEGEEWRISAPLATGADRDVVEGVLSSIEHARIERRLGAGEDPKAYGLDPPRATLTLELTAGDPRIVRIGDDSAIGGNCYALLPGGAEPAVISGTAADFARKDLLALRDKSLFDMDTWKVRRLRIERGKETVALEKIGDSWTIHEPLEAPADSPTVNDLLTALQNLKAREFPSEKPSPADLRRYGLAPPAARLSLLQEGWDVEKSVLFGKAGEGTRYARTVGRDPVLEVAGDFWEKVTTRIFDLRRKDLLGVSQYRVQTVSAIRSGEPALALKRESDGSWTTSDPVAGKVKSETMDTFLRHVSELKALRFRDRPTEAERARLIRNAALDLTLTEEPAGEGATPKTQHLVVGRPERDVILVRDMAWRPIAEVPAAVLVNIRRKLEEIVKEASENPPPAEPTASPSSGGATPAPTAATTPAPAATPSPTP